MDYRDIIESRYDRKAWQELLHDIFRSKVSFWREPSIVHASSRLAKQALNLGKISLADGESIAIYEVELTDNVNIERNRRGIRDMLTTDWRNMGYAGAFMFCYRQNESVLRFSYVSESWSFADDGTYKKDSTDTRRFTYLLGEGHRSRTAIQQFEGLKKSSLSLKDLTKAFSVDAVSDMFFDDYKQQYEDIIAFITGKRMVKVSNKWEERVVGEPNETIFSEFRVFADPEKAIRDYVKKLMGRLVFLQFLQKKGWLGVPVNAQWGDGDREFIQHLFENASDKNTFVDSVLEPLFNDINSEREGDLASPIVGKDIRVPYLNGGLFEPDAADAVDFPLPAKYMKSMLDFFASYNFTIDENDPDDAEMGVDPEMLGRIFENLLEDNKDKGAFYTPKEIVNYMCRESLIAYLLTDITDETQQEAIRQFVTTHKQVENLPDNILQNLIDVKICDPAIGSGAFPMGLLKELYLCRATLEGFDQKKAAEIKKHIIQQNIYGVDIERGAVDTARLRFWLAIIVDEESPEALPNLDFKIMQGNSLLEQYKGVDLSNVIEKKLDSSGMFSLYDDMLDVFRKELRDLLTRYFNCSDHQTKLQLRYSIVENVKKQLEEQGIDCDFGDLDIVENGQFFMWHTWFYDIFSQGGFDIVIGNPPYVSAPAQLNDEKLSQQREHIVAHKKFKSLYQKWDLYIPFMEFGMMSLKEMGVFSMIVPYPLTNQTYGKKLREIMLTDYSTFQIVDLNGTKIFENATVSNCIPFVRKSSPLGVVAIANINEDKTISIQFSKSYEDLVQDKKTGVWNLSNEIRSSNRHANFNLLGDFCYISKGMVLNADEKTAKGAFAKADLISDFKDELHSRPYIEAKFIIPYATKIIKYLEWGSYRCPALLSRPTFKELYDQPKLMINRLGKLQVYLDKEDKLLHSDSMFSAVLWKDLADVNNKSITSSIKKFSRFSRSEMENLSRQIDLRYIIGILNSSYADVLLTDLRGGDYHIYPEHMRNIPIPLVPFDIQKPICDLVDCVINLLKTNINSDVKSYLEDIDELVFKLYNIDI